MRKDIFPFVLMLRLRLPFGLSLSKADMQTGVALSTPGGSKPALSSIEGDGREQDDMTFWVYMLRCADGSFYTGHTDNLDQRMAQHETGIGWK